jgi:hypothetical protein
MHGSRPEVWYESDRSPDKPDRSPDSTDTPNKLLDAKDTFGHSSKSLDTVDTSDRSPDTNDDALPDSTKGRVTGLPNLKDSDRSSHLNNGDRSSPLEMPDSLSEDTSDRLSHFDKPDSQFV